jgi:[methyl-Co(III) methanol-specific corrinoid protein]:coenzyme M methyltransferase
VEAEVFGVEVNLGDAVTEARIVREPFRSARDVPQFSIEEQLRGGRVAVSIEAVRRLAATTGDLPIIANLIGPVSIAASVVLPEMLFREFRTAPDKALELIQHANDFLIAWSHELIAAGADVIAIHEDTGAPALLGPRMFERITLPSLARLIGEIHAQGARTLLHMCGKLAAPENYMPQLRCHGFIPESSVSIHRLGEAYPHLAMVGNMSTFLLHQGSPEQISKSAARLIDDGVRVVSPACGMASATPLANILALTEAVTHWAPKAGVSENSDEAIVA